MQQSTEWFYPRGTLSQGAWESLVDGSLPGWTHTGLRTGSLGDGVVLTLEAGDVERMILPLVGSAVVSWATGADRGTVHLAGRESVFDGPSDVVYVGVGTSVTITGTGRIAVAEAPATEYRPVVHLPKADVPVEIRGAGRSTRQVHNFGVPGALDAQKLIVCAVITPAENWSSFPAHKHDAAIPGHESRLEEIYYFESEVTRGATGVPATAAPFGMFATYSSAAGEIDINAMVHTGDIALVPFGYHGPAVAAPGYDLYYLNVMAGPGLERSWQISDDPAHGWVRETWTGQQTDPRLPYAASLTASTTEGTPA